jgi:hypothetical protein
MKLGEVNRILVKAAKKAGTDADERKKCRSHTATPSFGQSSWKDD